MATRKKVKFDNDHIIQAVSLEAAKKQTRRKAANKKILENQEVAAKQFFIHVKTISTTHRWKFTSVKAHTNAVTVKPAKLEDINLNNEEKDKILFKDNLENGIGTVSSTRNDTYAGAKCISTCISAMNDKVRSDNPIEQAKNIQEFIKDNDPIIVRSNKTSFIEGALQEAMYSPLNVEHRSFAGKGKKGSDKQGYSKKAGKTNPTIKLLTEINNLKHQIYKQKLDAFINPSNEATQGLEISANAPQPKQEQKDLPKIEQVTQQAFSQLLKNVYDYGNKDGEYINKDKKDKKILGKPTRAKLASFVKIAARDTHQADTLLETIIDQNIVNISASKLHEPSRKETQKVLSSYLFDKKGNIKGLVQLDVDRAQSQSESTAHQGAQDLNLDVFGNAETVKDYDKTAKIVQETQESNNVATAVVASLTKDIEAVLNLEQSSSNMTKMQQFYITGILDRLLPDANFTQKANLLRFAASQNNDEKFKGICKKSAKIIELEGKFIKKPNAKNYENLKIAGGGNVSQLIQNNSTQKQVGKLLRAIIAEGKPKNFQEAFDVAKNIKDSKLQKEAFKTLNGSAKSLSLQTQGLFDPIKLDDGSTMADPTLLQGFELAESLANTCPKITEKIYKNIENEITKYIENNREEILREMQKPLSKGEQKPGRDKLGKIISTKMGLAEAPPNVTNKLQEICKEQSTINKLNPSKSWFKSDFKPKDFTQKHDQQMLKEKIKEVIKTKRENGNKGRLSKNDMLEILTEASTACIQQNGVTIYNTDELSKYLVDNKNELIADTDGLSSKQLKTLKNQEKQEKSKQNEAPKLQRTKKSRNLLALVDENIANNQQPPKAVAADERANVTKGDTADLNQENQRPSLGAGA